MTPPQVGELEQLYAGTWWTPGRDRAGVERMLAGSTEIAAAVDPADESLAGFARALADGAYRATIYDLVVVESARGSALGATLLDELTSRSSIAACGRVELICHESMVDYYEGLGFGRSPDGLVRMLRPPLEESFTPGG